MPGEQYIEPEQEKEIIEKEFLAMLAEKVRDAIRNGLKTADLENVLFDVISGETEEFYSQKPEEHLAVFRVLKKLSETDVPINRLGEYLKIAIDSQSDSTALAKLATADPRLPELTEGELKLDLSELADNIEALSKKRAEIMKKKDTGESAAQDLMENDEKAERLSFLMAIRAKNEIERISARGDIIQLKFKSVPHEGVEIFNIGRPQPEKQMGLQNQKPLEVLLQKVKLENSDRVIYYFTVPGAIFFDDNKKPLGTVPVQALFPALSLISIFGR